jgi:peptidoglycan hydrolase-like protein with peptidoglycan-binding domain
MKTIDMSGIPTELLEELRALPVTEWAGAARRAQAGTAGDGLRARLLAFEEALWEASGEGEDFSSLSEIAAARGWSAASEPACEDAREPEARRGPTKPYAVQELEVLESVRGVSVYDLVTRLREETKRRALSPKVRKRLKAFAEELAWTSYEGPANRMQAFEARIASIRSPLDGVATLSNTGRAASPGQTNDDDENEKEYENVNRAKNARGRSELDRRSENMKRAEGVRNHTFMVKARARAEDRKCSVATAISELSVLEEDLYRDYMKASQQLSPAVRRRAEQDKANGRSGR